MGMYTELVIKAEIRDGISANDRGVLEFLFNGGDEPLETPEHEFFDKPRWKHIGGCCSYYHVPWATAKIDEGYLFSRSDLKNYDGEIEAFVDWVTPLLVAAQGDCIGWKWYEEDEAPTLLVVSEPPNA